MSGNRTMENSLYQALRALFKKTFGEDAQIITPISAEGSNRQYFRIVSSKRTAIGTFGPDRKENEAFTGFARHFRCLGFPVPDIYAQDPAHGLYLQEDLGDTTLFKMLCETRTQATLTEQCIQVYEKAVSLLPRIQIEAAKGFPWSLCYPRAAFDRQSMMWDMNHFKYYFLQLAQIPFHEQKLEEDFSRFADFLSEEDAGYVLLRDFQSRNIMIRSGEPFFIDFQGARRGALQYDIASLLYDAKADLPWHLRQKLLDAYIDAASETAAFKRAQFMRYYYGFVFIRIMQAMGAYGLRGFHERKPHFLQSIPYAIRNLEYLLRVSEIPVKIPELTGAFRRMVTSSYLRQMGQAHLKLTVRVQSFPYKNGIPMDETGHGGGYVFDCRCLPNPGRLEQFAKFTGKDPQVAAFLEKEPVVQEFLGHIFSLIEKTVENYRSRNFTDLLIQFGCTGGQHRSVYCAERLAAHLRQKFNIDIEVFHRALEKHPAFIGPSEKA